VKLAAILITLLTIVVAAGWIGYRATAKDRECSSRRPLRREGGKAETTGSVTKGHPGGELEPTPVEPGGSGGRADEKHGRRREGRPASDIGGGDTVQKRRATRR
jgi:hypothetical protein